MSADSEYQAPEDLTPAMSNNEPSLSEILEVVLPHVEKIEEGFSAIRIALDALSQHVAGTSPSAVAPRPTPAAIPAPSPSQSPPRPVPVQPVPQAVEEPTAAPTPAPVPQPKPEPPAAVASEKVTISVGGGNWSQIMFGENLMIDQSIGSLSGSLLSDVYQGSFDAMSLMGCLLTFRSEPADRKPRLLKDIGEAFYRWQPEDNPVLRDALITWIHAELDAVGVANRITLTQVGDRYDMQRHNAKERGVEVAQVQGWVVLRDNGKVYSKANVAVR